MSSKNTKNRFVAPAHWSGRLLQQNPIFRDLTAHYPLTNCNDWPSLATLNQWLEHSACQLVANEILAEDGRYYEQFIYATRQVPTRLHNWHDFFGACIWGLFPATKALLNQLHMAEIAEHGLQQRSKLRHKITLFDECGVIICLESAAAQHGGLLRTHQWQQSFVTRRSDWWHGIRPLIFGHAIYEMATLPFLGLTAKCLFIDVPAGFCQWSLTDAYSFVDQKLQQQIANGALLLDNQQLTPLPLLGVPGWWDANRQADFYQNTEYFRALSTRKISTRETSAKI
ncbi:transmembrane protein [Arsukibacterium ikkense]|uniref:Transmembrane protein n=1 Tax=Arsukibacterium ikkense TaxID=336831 RepID=A0A0M2V7W0_9GAMM|nr:DUF3025 domain-containing protein [Arsukibacterium ikkense]KKO45243.1 transmembrane protein [Arsukibacterium ikkense]